jgi:hypothetical protein
MADRYRRKRVRNMKRVLREHGSPVPRDGCLGVLLLVALGLGLLGWWGDQVVFGQKPRKSGCIF